MRRRRAPSALAVVGLVALLVTVLALVAAAVVLRGKQVADAPDMRCRWESPLPAGSDLQVDGFSAWPPGYSCIARTPDGAVIRGNAPFL